MINIDELEKLADNATPGPWEYDLYLGLTIRNSSETLFDNYLIKDGMYVAAMNPETTKHLIERIRKLEAVRDILLKAKIAHEKSYAGSYISGVVDCFPSCLACKLEKALASCETQAKEETNDTTEAD